MADWDSMGRVVTQTQGGTFQILDRAFHLLLRLQKLDQVFGKLGRVFEKLGRAFERLSGTFENQYSAESFIKESL